MSAYALCAIFDLFEDVDDFNAVVASDELQNADHGPRYYEVMPRLVDLNVTHRQGQ